MPAFYCILLSKHSLFIKLSSCHAIIRLTNVTQVSSTGTPGHILVNRYTRIKPTKSRLHTPISTLVHAEVICAPKILPIGIFLSHTLRSKITAPWDMSQYQNFTRISLETSVFYLNFQVRFFLVMLWTRRLDTAAKETWVRGQFSLYREWYEDLLISPRMY